MVELTIDLVLVVFNVIANWTRCHFLMLLMRCVYLLDNAPNYVVIQKSLKVFRLKAAILDL